jgi:hypothetical protein
MAAAAALPLEALREHIVLVDASFRARAALFHLFGPWNEVTMVLDTGRPAIVESGLAGVRLRS